jgi:hypothetical protein
MTGRVKSFALACGKPAKVASRNSIRAARTALRMTLPVGSRRYQRIRGQITEMT